MGIVGAPLEVAAELQAINSALTDIEQEARDEFLQEVLDVSEQALSPDCYAVAREALLDEFGAE